MVGRILLGTQILQRRVLFHICFSWLCLWCSFPLGLSCTKLLKLSCRWQWAKTDCFSSFRLVASPDIIQLNNMLGHLSSFTMANILVFTLSPSCLVLVGPSKKVRSSFSSSSRCKVKSSTFIWWCSCRPRRPKCCVSSHHMLVELVECFLQASRSARGLLSLLLSNFWIGLVALLCLALPGFFWS